jgi:hypothetical protein
MWISCSPSVGFYRLWPDAGYAVGAIVAGFSAAIFTIALLTRVSGIIVAVRMRESGRRLSPSSTATVREPASQSREP